MSDSSKKEDTKKTSTEQGDAVVPEKIASLPISVFRELVEKVSEQSYSSVAPLMDKVRAHLIVK